MAGPAPGKPVARSGDAVRAWAHGDVEVSLRLQGGLPPAVGLAGDVVHIACDESGFSGTNLLDAASPVITHASVDLCHEEAVEIVTTLRAGSRYSLDEFKSSRLLRDRAAGDSLEWFLEALRGRAHVQVVDKEFFLVSQVVDLFLYEPGYAAGTRLARHTRPAALDLYLAGRALGRSWDDFLVAFVGLVRGKRRREPARDAIERFFRSRDHLAANDVGAAARRVLDALDPGRVSEVLLRLAADDRSIPPPLEPMIPALAETVLSWSGGDRQVLVVHDEQSALTADRLRRLQQMLAGQAVGSPFAGLVAVDSRDDPRVQVADLLAGLARRSAESSDDGPVAPFISATSLRAPRG